MPAVPDGLQKIEITRGRYSVEGENFYLEIDDSVIHICPPASRLVQVWVGRTRLAHHPIAFNNVLSYAVQGMLRRCNLFTLHAAGAVEPETGGVALFMGDSNSGKSTLTVSLAAAGWRYLSDDMITLFEGSSGVVASGYRRFFAVTQETVSHLRGLEKGLGPTTFNDPNKRYLEPSITFPDSFTEACKPRALYFTSVGALEKSELREISQGDAMMRLIGMSPWASLDLTVARAYLRVFEGLVKQSRSYVLSGGRDILTEPNRAATLLARRMKDQA